MSTTYATLLDRLTQAGVSVTLSEDREHLVIEAPDERLTPAVEMLIRANKLALVAMLSRATSATLTVEPLVEVAPAEAKTKTAEESEPTWICRRCDAAHGWVWHPRRAAWFCLGCAGEAIRPADGYAGSPRPHVAPVFAYAWGGRVMPASHEVCPTCGAHKWGNLDGRVSCLKCEHPWPGPGATVRAVAAELPAVVSVTQAQRDELLAWAETHEYPRLPIAYATGFGNGAPKPYKWACGGRDGWEILSTRADACDVLLARIAAGLDPHPETPAPSPSSSPRGSERDSQGDTPTAESDPRQEPGRQVERQAAEGSGIAVLDIEGLWIARSRGKGQADQRLHVRTGLPDPATATGADLLALAQERNLSQLWVHPSWARAAGLPARLARDERGLLPRDPLTRKPVYEMPHPFIDAATAAGWDARAGKDAEPGLAFWLHCFRRGVANSDIDLIFPQYNEQHGRWPWATAPSGRTLLLALRYFAQALTLPHRSPGSVGTRLIRQLHSGPSAVKLEAPASLPEVASADVETEIAWRRPLTAEERGRKWIHAYDKNAMFLGACSSLSLGSGEAEHRNATSEAPLAFENLPGFWHARVALDRDERLPDTLRIAENAGAFGWYSTPVLARTVELGAAVTVDEAYTWPKPQAHKMLTAWYERVRDARLALKTDTATYPEAEARELALAAVKAVYTQSIGWLGSEQWDRTGDDLYRPDWRSLIIGQARANLDRNIGKYAEGSGMAPFMVGADCLYFTSDEPDPLAAKPAGMPIGETLADYKVKDAAIPLAELMPLLDADPQEVSVASIQHVLNVRAGRAERSPFESFQALYALVPDLLNEPAADGQGA